MANRPEWVCCITAQPDKSYCGRSIFREWTFTGLPHALATVEQGSRLVPCTDCLEGAKRGLCRYCHQPIYETEQTPGYQGLLHFRGKYLHIKGDAWACDPTLIDPTVPAPRCHICKTASDVHKGFCSAGGFPPYHATIEKEGE